jgi:hypothetical protein
MNNMNSTQFHINDKVIDDHDGVGTVVGIEHAIDGTRFVVEFATHKCNTFGMGLKPYTEAEFNEYIIRCLKWYITVSKCKCSFYNKTTANEETKLLAELVKAEHNAAVLCIKKFCKTRGIPMSKVIDKTTEDK